MRHHTVDVGDTSIAATRLDPPGPPAARAVVVHGMVVASRGVLPLARALRDRGVAVGLPDLPGFGRSGKPRRALDVDGLADALHGWMADAGLRGTAVIGNSFGTQVVGALAARHPGAAARVVLLSPTIDARFRGRWTRLLPAGRPGGEAWRGPVGALQRRARDALVRPPAASRQPSLGSLVVREYLAAGPARALSTYRHALRDDLAARMPHVDAPVLVVRGADDRLVSRAFAARLAAATRAGRCVEVPETGHDGQYEAPDRVAEVIVPFVVP